MAKVRMFMTMKPYDVARRVRMLRTLGNCCVICGNEFAHLACVTYEHVVPRSRGGQNGENLMLSHYSCNRLRGTKSILQTQRNISYLQVRLGPDHFRQWLSKAVPNRHVPSLAFAPIAEVLASEP